MKLLLTTALCCLCSVTWAQVLHYIQVVEYKGEAQKSPLAQVEVLVVGAGSTVTDREGKCTLEFRTAKPGDRVHVRRISKPGFVVFNQELLDNWYLPKDDKETFTIILCRSELLQRLEMEYMKTLSTEQEKSLLSEEKGLYDLHQSGRLTKEEYDRRIAALYRDYERKLNDLSVFVKRLSHIDLTEMSSNEQKTLSLMQQGDVAGALACLNTDHWLQQYRQQSSHIQTLEETDSLIEEHLKGALSVQDTLWRSLHRQLSLLEQEADSLALKGENKEALLLLNKAIDSVERIEKKYPNGMSGHSEICELLQKLILKRNTIFHQ